MRLIVDVTRTEPPAGCVRNEDGAEREFTTWLGLMAVLRAAVGDRPAATTGPPTRHDEEERA